jgi:hypothetical protein
MAVWTADDDVIGDFDLEQLACPHQIAGDFDVGVGRLWIGRGMIVS